MSDYKLLHERKHMPFPNVIILGKLLIFVVLILVEIILVVANRKFIVAGSEGLYALFFTIPICIVHISVNAIKLFVLRAFKQRIPCYVLDVILLSVLAYVTNGELISAIFVVVLSEFYLSQEKFWGNFAMGVSSFVMFTSMVVVSRSLKNIPIDSLEMLIGSVFGDFIIFVLHFTIENFMLLILRKNAEIDEQRRELGESNEKLRVALENLKEVTVLEERQRIAKDIHDTAGHSITTVIMQTEAAKLALDHDSADAKRKIIAANLQAKHALEELRESVHLLSGVEGIYSLKDNLLSIIHESTDGTGIVIRSDIENVELCQAKHRFLCNSLKEGISNGLRHGNATAFYFSLQKEGDGVNFLLSDNGCGMDSDINEGFGLSGMRRRAESLGGSVRFETEADEGFEVHIYLPLDRPEANEENQTYGGTNGD